MSGTEAVAPAKCAARVGEIQRSIFGRSLGNNYRTYVRKLREQDPSALARAARGTRGAILDCLFSDHTTAMLAVGRLARRRPHGALMFFALDLVKILLMNPEMGSAEFHNQLVKDVSRTSDAPIALILQCLQRLG